MQSKDFLNYIPINSTKLSTFTIAIFCDFLY